MANTSPFTRIMQRGHSKVRYTNKKASVLMALSEEDHKRIAQLLGQWLDGPSPSPSSSKKIKK